MLHARSDYNRIQDPENLIPEDEPVFLLRAKDRFAPDIVEAWAQYAEINGAHDDIVSAARSQAVRMREYQQVHGSKIPDMVAPWN